MEKNPTALHILVLFGIGHVFCETISVKAGADHTFTPTVIGQIESILWKYKANKLVEYEANEETWYRFRNRGTLDKKNGHLTLQGLTKDEGGRYEAEIQVAGKLQFFTYDVNVIDAVPVPTVTCNVTNNEITLQCSVDPPVQADFEWNGPNDFRHRGQRLPLSQPTNPESLYICTAVNVVSSESTQFALRLCYPDGGLSDGAIVGIVFAVILPVIIAVAAVVLRKNVGHRLLPARKT